MHRQDRKGNHASMEGGKERLALAHPAKLPGAPKRPTQKPDRHRALVTRSKDLLLQKAPDRPLTKQPQRPEMNRADRRGNRVSMDRRKERLALAHAAKLPRAPKQRPTQKPDRHLVTRSKDLPVQKTPDRLLTKQPQQPEMHRQDRRGNRASMDQRKVPPLSRAEERSAAPAVFLWLLPRQR
jgi:hypothetical protein